MDCETADHLLDAALDDELDPLQSEQLDAHLETCAACTRRLAGRRHLQQALRTQLPYYRAPAAMKRTISASPTRRWQRISAALAAALFLTLSLLTWNFLSRPIAPSPDAQLADAIESDHLRSLLTPENLTAVLSSDQHTVKPWFIGKLPYTPPVHDLAADGFPLVGGRLDILNDQPVAALVYRHGNHIINLFIWPGDTADTPITPLSTRRGYHLVHWTSAGMNFWAATDMDAQALTAFTESIRAHTR